MIGGWENPISLADLPNIASGSLLYRASAGIGPPEAISIDTAMAGYAKLAGRTGGQVLIGGTSVTDALILQGTSGNGTATEVAVQVKVGNNGGTVAATFLNNGKVGFGVSPTEKLNVSDTLSGNTVSMAFTATGQDHSGMRGIRMRKASADGNAHGISWEVDGVPKWDIEMDYQNADMVLAYDHTLSADILRIKPGAYFRFGIGGEPIAGTTIHVQTNLVGNKTLVMQALSLQTGMLTEWQDPSGNRLSCVTPDGRFGIGTGANTPVGPLHVYNGSADSGIIIGCDDNENRMLKFTNATGTTLFCGLVGTHTTGENGGLILRTRNAGAQVDALTIATTGAASFAAGFGCNGASAQAAYASGGALAAYGTGAFGFDSEAHASALHAMVVSIRAALVANGIMS